MTAAAILATCMPRDVVGREQGWRRGHHQGAGELGLPASRRTRGLEAAADHGRGQPEPQSQAGQRHSKGRAGPGHQRDEDRLVA